MYTLRHELSTANSSICPANHSFVSRTLHHNKDMEKDKKVLTTHKKVLTTHGNCKVHDYDSPIDAGPAKNMEEMEMYLMAMKIYCDLESGDAYHSDYEWPSFEKLQF